MPMVQAEPAFAVQAHHEVATLPVSATYLNAGFAVRAVPRGIGPRASRLRLGGPAALFNCESSEKPRNC